jgi:hypothetical protein
MTTEYEKFVIENGCNASHYVCMVIETQKYSFSGIFLFFSCDL